MPGSRIGGGVPGGSTGDNPLRGIAYMIVGITVLSFMDAMIKWVSVNQHFIQILFFRVLFAFLPVAALLRSQGGIAVLRTERLGGHAGRFLVMFTAACGFFYALGVLPLAEVVAIGFAAPLFMTALGIPLLGEQVGWRRWSAVLVGFAGVLVMVRPGEAAWNPLVLVPLAAAVFYALAMIASRQLSRTESSLSIVFYYNLFATAVTGVLLPFVWVTPSPADLAVLIGIGLLGGVGQFCLAQGFRYAPVAVAGPFEYLAILWAVLLGYLLWMEVPGLAVLGGALLVIASGVYIVHREAQLRRAELAAAGQPGAPPAAADTDARSGGPSGKDASSR